MLDIQKFTLPDFGLMSKADKEKLDDIADTYVTKAAAITSGEMTADGFVLRNALGNGVCTIPALSSEKQSPNLSVNPTSLEFTGDSTGEYRNDSSTVTVTRSGNGAISATTTEPLLSTSVSGNSVTITANGLNDDKIAHVTISVAAEGNYSADSCQITVTLKTYETPGADVE